MKRCLHIALAFATVALLCGLLPPDADARRFGGSRSFGSRPQYSKPAQPYQQRDTSGRQDVRQPAQAARPSGLFGGRGGLLGGLLMGSLIGSLLFGGGHAVGGPGLLDILVIGGVLFLVFRYLKTRSMSVQPMGPNSFREKVPDFDGGRYGTSSSENRLPVGFDEAEFIKGAKAAYVRLQESWDKRDLEDIRQFTTPEVWEEIRRQASEDPAPGHTSIVSVKAELLEVNQSEDATVAAVLFDVLMREDSPDGMAENVREVWHFSRKESGPDSFWRLEGIQQITH